MIKISKPNNLLLLLIGLLMFSGCTNQVVKLDILPVQEFKTDQPLIPEAILNLPSERMEEWNDWKFGLFIHWGPWSQTEIGAIWQIVKKDSPAERDQRFELYKTFNPTEFDADGWAQVAQDAGMRYVVFTTKHHDGFCNFETNQTNFKITNPECPYSGSTNPDITGEIVRAFREKDMAVGHYYSHIDWHHPQGKYFSRPHWDFDESRVISHPIDWTKFADFEKEQMRELMTNYGPIDIVWFDIRWPYVSRDVDGIHHRINNPQVKEDMLEIVQMMRKINPEMIINDRGVHDWGNFATPEQKIPKVAPAGYWETNMTISDPNRRKSGGFWYKGPDALYKSRNELMQVMAEVFSKGGNFLLNVGPQPSGKIPQGEIDRLKEIGDWMKINGEAVYGSKRSPFTTVPDWGFITRMGQKLYLWVFDWPASGETLALPFDNPVTKAWLLDGGSSVKVIKNKGNATTLRLPEFAPDSVVSIIAMEVTGNLP